MKNEKQKKRLLPWMEGVALFAIAAMLVVLPGCNKQGEENTPTEAPTVTVAPTETPTPEATATPRPTSTPRPTATPKPTPTATPTPDPLPDEKDNFVKNATFDESTEKWGFYSESGGEGEVYAEDGKLALKVTSLGTLNYAVQIYSEDIMKIEKDGVHALED